MNRYIGGKFRLWVGQPVNAAVVTPPASLRAAVVIAVVGVAGTLMFAVANQLTMGGMYVSSPEGMAFVALCFFVLPVLIAHTISMNWPVSRILVFVYAAAIAHQGFLYLDRMRISTEYKGALAAGIVLCLLLVLWWLFFSRRIRVYYALISNTDVPDDLDASPDVVTGVSRAESLFSRIAVRLAPYVEHALVALVFLSLMLALWSAEP